MFSKKHQNSKLMFITSNIKNVPRKWVLNIFLTLVLILLSSCSDKDNPFENLTVSESLSKQEQKIEQNFIEYLQNDPEGAIKLYREKFGKIISTDEARELSEDYNPQNVSKDANKIARSKWSSAVFKPAGALAAEVYERALKEQSSNPETYVVFTAGGAGSGKTSSIKGIASLQKIINDAQFIYDTTLSNEPSSRKRIEMALKAGKEVRIIYVYRDPIQSFVNGALPRAEDEGRTMSLDGFSNTHVNAPLSLGKIVNTYRGNKRIHFYIIDNNHGFGNAKLKSISFIQNIKFIAPEKLKQILLSKLEDAYNNGKISSIIYKAFKGKDN